MNEQQTSWLRGLAVISVPIVFIMLIPLGVTFFAYRAAANDRIADGKAAIARESRDRVQFNRKLNEFVFQQCISAEKRDAVVVKLLAAFNRESPSDLITEAIDALEPADEPDCRPPPASGP